MMDAMIAVAAAVVGGLLTALGAYANDRLRARDQRQMQWDERKVGIYAGFGEAVDDNISGLIHMAQCKQSKRPYYGQDIKQLEDAYRLSKERLRSCRQRVALVANPDIRHLADNVVKGLKSLQLKEAEGDQVAPGDAEFDSWEKRIRNLSEQFSSTASRDLGLTDHEEAASSRSAVP